MRRHGKPPTQSAIILTRECVSTGLAGKGSADVGPHTLGALGRPHGSLTCIRGPAPMSASGHETDMPTALRNVRSRGQSGKHMLAWSVSDFDPERTWPPPPAP